MTTEQASLIVVTGATGLQGSAVSRQLLAQGWQVRGLTRNARSKKTAALAASGAQVVQGDMADPTTLGPAFAGAYGVYSVQNTMVSGVLGEIQQGKNVANAARQANVQHVVYGYVVYGSAGTGACNTGVPSWDSKIVIEDHVKSLGLPLTILRPMAFMELMTDAKFFPHMSTWQVMLALMGRGRPLPDSPLAI
jgi:uncharacterized protein YbjT (DUF2867 family)